MLAACVPQEDTEDIVNLKKGMQELKKENQVLSNRLIELEEQVESNLSVIQKSSEGYEEISDKFITPRDLNYELKGIRDQNMKMNRYIQAFSAYQEVLCYIVEYDNGTDALVVDEIEWIGMGQHERINELGLDVDHDFPNPYYIHNESEKTRNYQFAEDTFFLLGGLEPEFVSKETFVERIQDYPAIFRIIIIDNKTVEISEVYTP